MVSSLSARWIAPYLSEELKAWLSLASRNELPEYISDKGTKFSPIQATTFMDVCKAYSDAMMGETNRLTNKQREIAERAYEMCIRDSNIKEGNLDFEIKNETNDEIGQLCQDFEEMRLRLKANAEEKVAYDKENKELISNISHDLKTPITAIKGYVEGIMDGVADTPEKMDRYIKTIYNKANEMDLLINELTFYSKIDTNRIPYNFTTISAKQYFGDCAEDLFMELEAKGVQFRYRNYLETDSKVIVDPEQLRSCLLYTSKSWNTYSTSMTSAIRFPITSLKSFSFSFLIIKTTFSNPALLASKMEKSMMICP